MGKVIHMLLEQGEKALKLKQTGNNESTCRRHMGDREGCRKAADEGLTHYTTDAIRKKLENNKEEAAKPIPEPTPEEKALKEAEHKQRVEEAKVKAQKQKEEFKDL